MINKNTTKSIFAYSTLGIQLAFFMVLFVYGGYRLDNYFNTTPWLLVTGAFLGMGSGLYNLIKGMRQMKMSGKEKTGEKNKNNWL